MSSKNFEKNKENGQFKTINDFSDIENNEYIVKWLYGIKSKNERLSLMYKFCNFLGKNPSQLAQEHQEDLKLDVLERTDIAKKQLNSFFGYLTNTKDIKFKNTLNKKVIEKKVNWNSARQYVYSKLLSYYKRLGIPVEYNKKEKPKEVKKAVREKTWRKDGVDKDGNPVKKMIDNNDKKPILKQIRDSFNSLRDNAIFLSKLSSSLDDVDLFNLKIDDFRKGYLPDYNICYLHGERQKDDMLYQTFFGSESCNMIELYLKDRLNKLNKKGEKIPKLANNEYLFESLGKRMDSRYFSEKFKEIIDKLELYNITPKSLRRFFNTTLEANSINKGIIRRLMGHKGDIGDEHYNMMFENAKEGEFQELATFFIQNIDALISLGNGNRKYTKVEKRVKDLEQLNKNLITQLDNTNKKIDNISKVLLQMFAKAYEIDDLDDLVNLKVNIEYDADLTESELKEKNKRDNLIIQYILKVKKDSE